MHKNTIPMTWKTGWQNFTQWQLFFKQNTREASSITEKKKLNFEWNFSFWNRKKITTENIINRAFLSECSLCLNNSRQWSRKGNKKRSKKKTANKQTNEWLTLAPINYNYDL